MPNHDNARRTPKIGVTERGDGGLDLSWVNALKSGRVDAAIVITKNLNQRTIDSVVDLNDRGYKIAVHAGCTGWGHSWLEPRVPEVSDQLEDIRTLLERGFDNRRITLRVDPIIPTYEGLERVADMLDQASDILGSNRPTRVRMSVLDEYPHVKERLRALGREPFYKGNRRYATDEEFTRVLRTLDAHIPRRHGHKTIVETCAEPRLVKLASAIKLENISLVANGCVSRADFEVLSLPTENLPKTINGQNRGGCLCLTCKSELLANKKRCPHGCVYCYWLDK